MLVAMSGQVAAEVQYLPCTNRVELKVLDNKPIDLTNDSAWIGTSTVGYNLYRYRVWAEFDISALEGSIVTGVGFRVHNTETGGKISSLRYNPVQLTGKPLLADGLGNDLLTQYNSTNLYPNFIWNINSKGWTPSEEGAYFEPNWDEYRRTYGNGNSLIEDLQADIDGGKLFFSVGFSDNDSDRANLRLSSGNHDPESIFMKVITEDIFILLIPVNLGAGSEGGATTPMTCNSINFATGNKYKKESDLILTGPGLPLTYTRY